MNELKDKLSCYNYTCLFKFSLNNEYVCTLQYKPNGLFTIHNYIKKKIYETKCIKLLVI